MEGSKKAEQEQENAHHPKPEGDRENEVLQRRRKPDPMNQWSPDAETGARNEREEGDVRRDEPENMHLLLKILRLARANREEPRCDFRAAAALATRIHAGMLL
ncbi:MAG TPA: hypothetical protein VGG65_05010 [Thermoanaerobaculia bacterium]